jgi:hypothetical protein
MFDFKSRGAFACSQLEANAFQLAMHRLRGAFPSSNFCSLFKLEADSPVCLVSHNLQEVAAKLLSDPAHRVSVQL